MAYSIFKYYNWACVAFLISFIIKRDCVRARMYAYVWKEYIVKLEILPSCEVIDT